MVGDKSKSFAMTFTKGKSLTQQYQPIEGLYKTSYYGSARKRDKEEPKEESKTYVTEEYNVK